MMNEFKVPTAQRGIQGPNQLANGVPLQKCLPQLLNLKNLMNKQQILKS